MIVPIRRLKLMGAGVALAGLVATAILHAQRPQVATGTRPFVKVDAPVVALAHARVIDGTGAPARADQTLILRDGNISEMGPSATVKVPEGAMVIDLTGKSVIPGLVMLHEHLYYPTATAGAPRVNGNLAHSFTRLYLAGGVTSLRTAGNENGFMDFILKQRIDSGEVVGPWMDVTGPYLNGPYTSFQMRVLKDAADARRQVNYWADMGATSFKAYMQITRAELSAAIDEAHKRGLKLTGHLCSITLSEAADLGIDGIEHAFMAATDFVANKQPDVCPGQSQGQAAVAAVDVNGAAATALIKKLVEKKVALTSTLPVFETFTPQRPLPPGLDVLVPELKTQFERTFARTSQSQQPGGYRALFPKGMALELAFARAGGLLVAGTDSTGSGGVIPGYADQREIELLVEAGFTPLEAIKMCTLNGAKALGRDTRVGTIAVGKQADLVVINGDPATTIADVRKVETVFKQGIGFDPAKLIASVMGKVGLW